MASDVSMNTQNQSMAVQSSPANVTALSRPQQPRVEGASATSAANAGDIASPLSGEQLTEVVNALNENNYVVKRSLQFNVDDQTGTTVITVRNSQTDEVIRQIPSEALLKLAQRIEALNDAQKEALGLFLQSEI